jgi:hypothetical protein
MFNSLPGRQKAQAVETPPAQAFQVPFGFLQRERATHEGDRTMVKETFPPPGGAIRDHRRFAATPQIDAAQKKGPSFFIDQSAAIDA